LVLYFERIISEPVRAPLWQGHMIPVRSFR